MPKRFFLAQSLAGRERVLLAGGETHHLRHVLRLGVGDEVVLFDGTGAEATASIIELNDAGVTLAVTDVQLSSRELPVEITLATAVPKGDRFAWLVEKATELGVARIIPLRTKRSVVDPGAGKLDKVRHTVVEASKQCGRSRLLDVTETLDFAVCVRQEFPHGTCLVADPTGSPWTKAVQALRHPPASPARVLLAIGPEGGFTPDEVALARTAGAELVSLGPRILRIETAALALAAWFALEANPAT